jgi:hypothetical protein
MSNQSFACLILLFQRFEHFQEIVYRLSLTGVNRFYLALDGPRNESDYERQEHFFRNLSSLSRQYSVTFEVSRLSKNYGIFINMVSALDWFFEENAFGYILEDDTIPHVDFCEYVQSRIEVLNSSPQLLMVSGWRDSDFPKIMGGGEDLSRFPMIWGWATSREKWHVMREWFFGKSTKKPRFKQSLSRSYGFWRTGYKRAISGRLDSWANVLGYNYLLGNYKSLVPSTSMIENVGLDSLATNTRVSKSFGFWKKKKSRKASNYDVWLEKNLFRISFRHLFAPWYASIINLFCPRTNRVPPLKLLQSSSKDGLSGLALRNSL